MIRLYNYFFDEDKCEVKPIIKGETTQSFSVKFHTDYVGKYYEINLRIRDLNKKEHGLLIYILYLLYPDEGEPLENILFVSNIGEEYNVIVPLPDGYNFTEEDKGIYTWTLRLIGKEV